MNLLGIATGACLVSPKQLDTPYPLNCCDEDLEAGVLFETSDSLPSSSFKLRFSAKLGSILRTFFEELDDESNAK